jgi:hypothetical protein
MDGSVGRYQIVMSLEHILNFVHLIRLSFDLLWSIACHTFISLPLDGFPMSTTQLVSSPLLILGPSTLRLSVTTLSMKRHCHSTSEPSCDLLPPRELCLTPCVGNPNAGSLLTGR